jgi:CelD/BcsL family acetyltransferase involved in cellulose biosynthesis
MMGSGNFPELELMGSAYLRSEKPVTFPLQLGEFVLSRKSFNAVVLYFELGEHPELAALAAANLRDGLYDLVAFRNVDATLRTGLLRWSSGHLWYAPVAYPLYCVDLKGSFEDYLCKFSQKSRKNLRRDREKLKRLSGNDEYFREYRRPEEMEEFCCAARSISAKTYQERLLGVGLPDSPEFVKEMIRRAEHDLVRGYILYDKDHPVAFAYCSGRGKQLTYNTIGYDPAYTDHSPGRVLLYCLLDRLFAEKRFDLFDFGMGDGFYKSFFSTHSFNCVTIFCFRLSARNLTFVISHAGLVALSRTVVRLTQALGIKDKIKKWARANVGRS